jgi:hypothetical protein
MGVKNPWRLAATSTPWETFIHSSSRRTGYVFRRLNDKMNGAHKIAVFGKVVYILYVVKIPEDSGILLFL